jgi:hypothetical protein
MDKGVLLVRFFTPPHLLSKADSLFFPLFFFEAPVPQSLFFTRASTLNTHST